MDRLFVFNTAENIEAILQNKDGSNACPYWEATVIEQLNGQFTFEFQTLSNHRDAKYLIRGNKIGFWNPDNEFLLFDISKTDDEHGDGLIKTVICEHSIIVELNDDIVKDKRPTNVTADVALSGILTDTVLGGSMWKVGTVAPLGTATPENVYYEPPLSGVQKIITAYKTDYKPRIVMDPTKPKDRFIDLGPRGTDTGRRFEYNKDLKQIRREVDMTGVKTALVGRGKGEETGDGYGRRIDFADVVWTKTGGKPADKPIGQIFVGDPAALASFGHKGGTVHRLGVFEDAEETDPSVLLTKTWDHLQTINTPRVTYSMNVLDLAELTGLDHQKVRLGDTVVVIDREFVPALTIRARVIEKKNLLGEPEKTEIKLGNYISLFTDEMLKIEELERKLNDRSGIWDGVTDPIAPGDFEDITPPPPADVTATGIFKSIAVDWTFENDITIAQYEVYASKTAGFTPDALNGSNLVFRGLAGAFVHKAATNEKWYFRVRCINRNGTAGPFSLEVSASTVSIAEGDITPQVITNNLIAAEANIDFAKIANVVITTAMIQNLSVDVTKIKNAAVETAKIKDGAITNAKINDLDAVKITAGKVATRFLDVRDIQNFVWNSDCSQEGGYTGTIQKPGPAGNPGAGAVIQTSRDGHAGEEFNVEPGEVFHVGGWTYNVDSNIEFTIGVVFYHYDGSNSWHRGAIFSSSTKGAWRYQEGTVKAPTNAYKGKVWYQINATSNFGTWYHTRTFVRRQGLLTADRIITGTLDANNVTVKGGTSDKYVQITADGLVSNKGAVTIKRPDGAVFMQDGLVQMDFAIQPTYPADLINTSQGTRHYISDRTNTQNDGYIGLYTFRKVARYLEFEVALSSSTVSYAAIFKVIESGTNVSLGQLQSTESLGNETVKKLRIDMGIPDFSEYAVRAMLLHNYAGATAYCRIIRIRQTDF